MTEHRRGPAAIWFDPVHHVLTRTVPLVRLDANEAIVVYRPVEGNVVRRLSFLTADMVDFAAVRNFVIVRQTENG